MGCGNSKRFSLWIFVKSSWSLQVDFAPPPPVIQVTCGPLQCTVNIVHMTNNNNLGRPAYSDWGASSSQSETFRQTLAFLYSVQVQICLTLAQSRGI
jgi:hypothetical protein